MSTPTNNGRWPAGLAYAAALASTTPLLLDGLAASLTLFFAMDAAL